MWKVRGARCAGKERKGAWVRHRDLESNGFFYFPVLSKVEIMFLFLYAERTWIF